MFPSAGSSRQNGECAREEKAPRFPYRLWLLSLVICAALVAVAFVYVDVPVARRVNGLLGSATDLANGLSSAILLGVEAAAVLAMVIIRIARGHLSPMWEATALACLSSICAYAINDGTLKLFFGVPNPAAVLHGTRHAIHLLSGSSSGSFPSGHMVLASAFAGVFMRLYKTSTLTFSALLLIVATLLVAGNWHFVSDVIAGTFVGVSVGLLAAELWLVHSR